MNTVTTAEGAQIYFKDWGAQNAQPIVFHHGWPLSADDWDSQMRLKTGTLKVYTQLPHGMCTTHADVINADLFAFIKG